MHGRFVTGYLPAFVPLVLSLALVRGMAAPPSPNSATNTCAAQAEGFLDARLGIWQQRLKLADWKISVVMSHPRDLKPATLGNIHWDAGKKTAAIRVLHASDYQLPCHEALTDMELTLVHELVHLELSSLPRSQASRHEEELAVNRITDALLRLDRQEEQSAGLGVKPDTSHSRVNAPGPAW
jgi:hypothetical protein